MLYAKPSERRFVRIKGGFRIMLAPSHITITRNGERWRINAGCTLQSTYTDRSQSRAAALHALAMIGERPGFGGVA